MLGTEQPATAARGFSLAPRDWLRPAVVIVFGTGFVSFALEVAWFRALRAAFQSTTEVFAIILAAVLIPLAIAARWIPRLRRRGVMPKVLLGNAAIAILVAAPLVERMDLIGIFPRGYLAVLVQWALLQLVILGPAVLYGASPDAAP